MDLRDKAIGGIAVVEFCIRQTERELADGRKKATEADLGETVIEAFDVAQIKARKLHRALEALRTELAASVGSPDEQRSGGDADDKDTPEDPPVEP